MQPSSIGPYAIVAPLGAGGMGEVYRAVDRRLGREVAIKMLPAAQSIDPDALERFRLEARSASRLSHPNICTIHDVGEHEGRPYIVMECLEGRTLSQVLASGPLDPSACLDLAVQLADALDAAHTASIVHRDIKPANIMVTTRGQAKVLDFGIAKFTPPRVGAEADATWALDLTRPGAAIGTVAYMSPEQALGRTVDARSDLFSFGAVLYEMATGSRAFQGDTAAAVSDAVLHGRPVAPPPPSLAGLSPILNRLLQKDPQQRYASAAAVLADLQRLRTQPQATVQESQASIAVLPFVNLSAEADTEYFADGMAEEIIVALGKVGAIRVASRTSSFAFKGRQEDARAIGHTLGVASILEGSVRRAGARLRVSVQLVSVNDGYQMWTERFDRQLEDVFAVQDEIAENVASALRIVLTEEEREVLRKVPTEYMEAYDYYLRGRENLRRLERTSFTNAREMFEHAVAIDPKFTLAWVGIVEACHWQHGWFGHDPELVQVARDASAQALALDPQLPEAHVALGLTHDMAAEPAAAQAAFRHAATLDPSNFDAHYFSARTYVSIGDLEQAAVMYARAAEVRPDDYQAPALAINCFQGLGRMDEARAWAVRADAVIGKHLELHPTDVRAVYLRAGAIWIATGDRERALECSRRALELDPDSFAVRYNVACGFALMGYPEEALDLLERNVAQGWGQRAWLVNDSDMASLRDHPRFKRILEQLQ